MYQFPIGFLHEMSADKELTSLEMSVFVERMHCMKSYESIAEELSITSAAASRRMTGVYRKFEIFGDSRGKEIQLRKHLSNKYKEWTTCNPSLKEEEIIKDSRVEEEIRSRLNPIHLEIEEYRKELSRLKDVLNLKNKENEAHHDSRYLSFQDMVDRLLDSLVNEEISVKDSINIFSDNILELLEEEASESSLYSLRDLFVLVLNSIDLSLVEASEDLHRDDFGA